MKAVYIQEPRGSSTTCSLWRLYYDGEDGRGKKKYLGSFNLSVNPADLPAGINCRPGFVPDGVLVEEIREVLLRRGTYGQLPKVKPEVMDRITAHVEKKLAAERLAVAPGKLHAAVEALAVASSFVAEEADRLRGLGVRLSPGMLNSKSTQAPAAGTALDLVKVDATRVRAAFEAFEGALKAAGLMKSVARGKSMQRPRGPAKS